MSNLTLTRTIAALALGATLCSGLASPTLAYDPDSRIKPIATRTTPVPGPKVLEASFLFLQADPDLTDAYLALSPAEREELLARLIAKRAAFKSTVPLAH